MIAHPDSSSEQASLDETPSIHGCGGLPLQGCRRSDVGSGGNLDDVLVHVVKGSNSCDMQGAHVCVMIAAPISLATRTK